MKTKSYKCPKCGAKNKITISETTIVYNDYNLSTGKLMKRQEPVGDDCGYFVWCRNCEYDFGGENIYDVEALFCEE